ncbi:MAG: GAF domain-containing sensor histidine kinase [Armatimonadetes bacterium]|nr:GAF domain-containing sensor histidine kinase [Armatimonadota bacterium]MDW8122894.1 GAF domain-containing protein [Armatimonadota bacterium]
MAMTMKRKASRRSHFINQRQAVRLLRSGILLRFDFTLEEMLRHIVETARQVIGSRYAALAVVDEQGKVVQFIHSGITPERARKIGELPKGRGLLGLIMESGRPIRLKDLTRHPKAWGFPPHHPPMKSFLGVPISVGGKPYGRLYLTEKIGAPSFTKADEDLAVLLAAQASAALERALLTERARQTERLVILNEIVSSLNRLTSEASLMEAVVKGVEKAVPYAEASLCLYREEEDAFAGCVASAESQLGRLHQRWKGKSLKVSRTPFGACIRNKEPIRVADLQKPETPFARWLLRHKIRSFIAAPIVLDGAVMGILFAGSRYANPFSDEDLTFLKGVADQVAVGLKNVRLLRQLREKERLRGLLLNKVLTAQEEERRRISHELHDQIGQLITALLIQLQILERDLSGDALKERLVPLRQLADQIASQLHHIAWELRPPALDELGLPAALERTVSEWSARFGIPCLLQFKGLDGAVLPPEVSIGVYRIVQEALTNVAKHSKATSAQVSVCRQGNILQVTITDDGVGFHPAALLQEADQNKKLGLVGMMERAVMLSGKVVIDSQPGEGTQVTALLPINGTLPPETSLVLKAKGGVFNDRKRSVGASRTRSDR